MNIDLFTATGTKKGTATLPAALFEGVINQGLMHQAVIRQQANARHPISHAKTRAEVSGSTRKLFQQKGTGRARRGSIRSPLMRGGGKAFGPRSVRNYELDMPQQMRRAALVACLSLQAKQGAIIALENYPTDVKTKQMNALLTKLPVELGRRILIVTADKHQGVSLSARNIHNVKTITAPYLNPIDVLGAKHIVFLVDAIKKAEEVFGKKKQKKERVKPEEVKAEGAAPKAAKKPKTATKAKVKKTSKASK